MVEPPPPPPPPEAAPPPPPPEPGRCPNCGAPHDVYQEYCLECGRRLPGAYVGGRYAEVWRRDSPIWLWAALAALLLVALVSGAVVALAATDDGKSSEPATSIPVVSTAPSTTSTVGVVTTPPTITINSAHDDARDDDVLDHDLRHDDVRDDHHRQQRHLAAVEGRLHRRPQVGADEQRPLSGRGRGRQGADERALAGRDPQLLRLLEPEPGLLRHVHRDLRHGVPGERRPSQRAVERIPDCVRARSIELARDVCNSASREVCNSLGGRVRMRARREIGRT